MSYRSSHLFTVSKIVIRCSPNNRRIGKNKRRNGKTKETDRTKAAPTYSTLTSRRLTDIRREIGAPYRFARTFKDFRGCDENKRNVARSVNSRTEVAGFGGRDRLAQPLLGMIFSHKTVRP